MKENRAMQTPVEVLSAERFGVAPEDLSQELTEERQLAALRRTLYYVASHSVFYKEKLKNLDPDEIRNMEDLQRIPMTSESDLAGHEDSFCCIPPQQVDRMVTVPTTGTRGHRKRLAFTAADQQKAIDYIYRGFLTMGCRKGERMLVLMSGESEGSIGDLVKRAMAPLEMEIKVHGSVTDIAEAYEAMMEFRPDVVEAIPWHAAALARYGSRFGNPEAAFIRSVNLSADVVPDAVVSRLEKLWNCSVHRHYGSTEMCIFGGVECIHHQGYHLRHPDILYEIPKTNEQGIGELLITTLDREAMPLIRYRTGDLCRMTDLPCACGCRLKRIEKVFGRESSLISLGDSRFFLQDLADRLYEIPEVTDFDVAVEASDNADSGSLAAKRLELTVRSLLEDALAEEEILGKLALIPAISKALKTGPADIMIRREKMTAFPAGYNLKKNVHLLQSTVLQS